MSRDIVHITTPALSHGIKKQTHHPRRHDQGLTKTEAARKYNVTWRWVHTLIKRYEQDGEKAFESQPTRPKTNPRSTPEKARERIIRLRGELTKHGPDNGPATIAWHLQQEGLHPPSTSTIRRILHTANLITPEPHKRPRSSYIRFEASQPNETWQSDITHWALPNGTTAHIIGWLGDLAKHPHPTRKMANEPLTRVNEVSTHKPHKSGVHI